MNRLSEILGQEAAIAMIARAYRLDRLPHGMIFAGPAGVGKATTARALGGLFLCEKPRELDPCGGCESCRAFEMEIHPDYHLIYRQLVRLDKEASKAKELSVDVIREFLIAKAANKSVLGQGKVFVIEQAELMNVTAQNALLKTLEEPAGRTLIILLTDQPDALLPTVRSRCQLVRFSALSESVVREQLEKRGIDRQVALTAAKLAEGSLGLAIRWIEDGVIARATQLIQIMEKIAAGQSAQSLQQWLRSAVEEYAERQLQRDEHASRDQAAREGLSLYLKLFSRQLSGRLKLLADDPESLQRVCRAIDAIISSEQYLESNVNIPLVIQQLVGALDRAVGLRTA